MTGSFSFYKPKEPKINFGESDEHDDCEDDDAADVKLLKRAEGNGTSAS